MLRLAGPFRLDSGEHGVRVLRQASPLWPLVAVEALVHPDRFDDEFVRTAQASVGEVRRYNERIVERIAPLLEAFEERGIRWAVLGAAGIPGGEGLRLSPLRLLVHPYDAPRARVGAVARGFRRTGEGWQTARFMLRETDLILETGLHPRGWPAVPLSPFLETASTRAGNPLRFMAPDASWAAQRLLIARELWNPAAVSLAQLVELVLLSEAVDVADRETWTGSVRRWRLRTLWQRCDELESWLKGGTRPDWLDPGFGSVRSAAIIRGRPPLMLGVTLQDTLSRKLVYALARLVRR